MLYASLSWSHISIERKKKGFCTLQEDTPKDDLHMSTYTRHRIINSGLVLALPVPLLASVHVPTLQLYATTVTKQSIESRVAPLLRRHP